MANTESIQVFSDASGCPAFIRHGRYGYACDTIKGEIRMRLHTPVYGSRIENKIAYDSCLAEYKRERAKLIDAEWLARNIKLYSE